MKNFVCFLSTWTLKIIIFHFHTVKFQQDLLNKKSFHISNMLDPYIHRQNQVENSWASVTQMGRIFAIYPTNLWDFPPKKCSVLPNDRSPSVLMLMCSELISQGSKEVTGSQNLLGVSCMASCRTNPNFHSSSLLLKPSFQHLQFKPPVMLKQVCPLLQSYPKLLLLSQIFLNICPLNFPKKFKRNTFSKSKTPLSTLFILSLFTSGQVVPIHITPPTEGIQSNYLTISL